MGKGIVVNTLEEMCGLMCDNEVPEDKESWIFTFGCGHQHSGHYVKIYGTYYEARQKMFDRYGDQWCFQYSEKEWQRIVNNPNRWYEIETELEVIE